jgi:hypothetical protein
MPVVTILKGDVSRRNMVVDVTFTALPPYCVQAATYQAEQAEYTGGMKEQNS